VRRLVPVCGGRYHGGDVDDRGGPTLEHQRAKALRVEEIHEGGNERSRSRGRAHQLVQGTSVAGLRRSSATTV